MRAVIVLSVLVPGLLLGTPAAHADTSRLPEAHCTVTGLTLEIGGPYRARLHVTADVESAGTFTIVPSTGDEGQLGWLDDSGTAEPELHLSADTDYVFTVGCPGSTLQVSGRTPPPTASPGQSYGPFAVCRWEGLSVVEAGTDSVVLDALSVVASAGRATLGLDGPGPTAYLPVSPEGDYTRTRLTWSGLAPDTAYTVTGRCDGDTEQMGFRTLPAAHVTVTGPAAVTATGPTVANPLTATAVAADGTALSATCAPATLPLDRTTVVTCTSAQSGIARQAVRVSGVDGQLRVLAWDRALRPTADAARQAFASGDLGVARRRLLAVQRAAQQLPRWSRGPAVARVRQVAAVGGVTL